MKKFLKDFINKIWKISITFNLYFISALILAILTKPISSKKKKNILVLAKPIFNEDIFALDRVSEDIGLLNFPRLLLNEILYKYFESKKSLTEENYHALLDGSNTQQEIYHHTLRIFKYLKQLIGFDGVISGNYVYINQQEFFRAAISENVPVFVLYKEGLAPSGSFNDDIKARLYSGKIFNGTKIFFYNEETRSLLVQEAVKGITYENSAVVGVPRLDRILKGIEDKSNNKKIITFFGYSPIQKTKRFCENDEIKILFEECLMRFQNKFIDFAQQNKEWHIKLKFKSDHLSNQHLMRLRNDLENRKLNNISFTNEKSLDLIKESKFIAGFASTVLLEALAMRRNIIIPDTTHLQDLSKTDYFYPMEGVACYLKDSHGISEDFLNEQSKKIINEKSREFILEKYLFRSDGFASERLYNELYLSLSE